MEGQSQWLELSVPHSVLLSSPQPWARRPRTTAPATPTVWPLFGREQEQSLDELFCTPGSRLEDVALCLLVYTSALYSRFLRFLGLQRRPLLRVLRVLNEGKPDAARPHVKILHGCAAQQRVLSAFHFYCTPQILFNQSLARCSNKAAKNLFYISMDPARVERDSPF
ncbi:hypothetical protein B0H16DRAFT_541523 [Mycena metata]|uniref:Uncharacterized protein n=1 Tax=Mycena metata TaxID=1033252 RepID=A0AAD7H6Z1_9AGAR|nr:hypothetical protein B0H16DRAFT_541523 [Mycena metata]